MSEQRQIKGFGWKPDLPDPRDFVSPVPALRTLPPSVSLRDKMPVVYDQGDLGSCTANAIAGCVQYQQMLQNEAEGSNVPSRLFIYYCEREMEGSVAYDSGALIRDGMKVVNQIGAPPETDWAYDVTQFAAKPPAQAYTDAANYKTLKYARVYRSSYYLRSHIVVGRPIVFGFTVFNSFWNSAGDPPYICAMPAPNESVDGGHATVCVGYKTTSDGHILYEIRNSWGSSWGDGGYFYMPEAYLLDKGLSSDFWNILTEE